MGSREGGRNDRKRLSAPEYYVPATGRKVYGISNDITDVIDTERVGELALDVL